MIRGTRINSGGGGDIIYIGDKNGPGLDNIKTFVEIDTQDKVNKSILTIDDKGSAANHVYELDQKAGLTRDGNKLIRFKNVLATKATLLLPADKGLPPNGLQIIRWLAGSSLDVAGGEGQDIIALSANASTLDDIQGQITLAGGGNQDQLYIIDSEYKDGDNYSIIGNTLGAANRANLELKFNGFEDLTLITGHGKDKINLEKFSPSVHLTLDGRAQYDTVNIISGEVLEPTFLNIERINLLGGKLTFNQPPDPIRDFEQTGGILTGSATLTVTNKLTWTGGTMSGSGTTAFTPDSKNSKAELVIGGSVTLQDRTLVNNGNATWNATISGGNGTFQNYGALSGQGSLAGHLANFGDFYPGGKSAPGAVAIDGDFTHAGGSLQLDLSDYGSDSISVSGTVTLGGALNLKPLTTLAGNVYGIIGNTGSASVVDIFAGQPEGTLITLGDRVFYITYQYLGGPDGLKNDVALVFNQPPVLDPIGNKLTVLGCGVFFTATATDPDQAFQNLTFSLAGAPAGASIDPSSGEFYWQPTLANAAAGNYSFTVRVTDDGYPNLYDEETITISVFDWFPYVDNYGSFAYVAGPSPVPLGLGSFRMGTGAEEGNKVFLGTAAYNGALLSSFSTFTYSAFVAASQVSTLAPYLNLYLDLNGDGLFDPANDNLIVYDPSLNSLPVVKNLWQTHNAGAGFWYGFIPNGKIAGLQTLAQIAANYPSARVIAPWGSCTPGTVIVAGSSVGVGWTNFLAYVDKVTINAGGTLRTFDFEPAQVSIDNLSKPEGNEGTSIFTFTVSLAQILPAPVGVSFNTTDGTATTLGNDYQMAVGTLVFEPGQTVQTITVLVNGDTDPEADETFLVKLLPLGNAVLINEQAQGTILNDDAILLASSMMAEGALATRSSFGETLNQAALLDRQSSSIAGRLGVSEGGTRQQRWEAALDAVFSRWERDFPGNSSALYYGIKVRKESSENDFDVLWDLPVEVLQRWFPQPKE